MSCDIKTKLPTFCFLNLAALNVFFYAESNIRPQDAMSCGKCVDCVSPISRFISSTRPAPLPAS